MYFGGEVMLTKERIVAYLENEAVRPLSEAELAGYRKNSARL